MTAVTTKIQLKEPSQKLQELIVKVCDIYNDGITNFNEAIKKHLKKVGVRDFPIWK